MRKPNIKELLKHLDADEVDEFFEDAEKIPVKKRPEKSEREERKRKIDDTRRAHRELKNEFSDSTKSVVRSDEGGEG